MSDQAHPQPADCPDTEVPTETRQKDSCLASEQRLGLALQSARMGMWEWDVRTGCSTWSPTEYEVLGLPIGSGQERASSFFSCIHPEDLAALKRSLELVMESGSEWHHDCRIIRPDGTVRWLAGAGMLHRDPEGRPLRMLGVNYDITARKESEEALRESRAKLEAAMASMTDAVFISDAEGRFVDFNDAFVTFHRFASRKECLKTLAEYPAVLDLLVADGTPLPLSMWAVPRALRGETAASAEYTLRRKDTGETWVGSYSFGPIRGKDGTITGAVVTARDITEQKRTTAALARAEALSETNRQKDSFLATLGHELRNPLVPIRNAVVLLQRSPASPAQEGALALIDRQLTHLTRLLDDLLDISRIERGKIVLRMAEFELGRTVQSAIADYQRLVAADGVSLSFAAPPGPLWARGDSERITQVVSNLITNACKFTESGGQVSVELTAEDERVAVLTVRDTGIGMDAETLQAIFRPFAQADRSLSRSRSGLGLGLALVKSLAELHGGSVRGSSPGPGQGSEFQVRLPILTQGPTAALHVPVGAAAKPRPRSVLIVEDNIEAAETLKLLLEDSGHAIAVAYSGVDGLKLARSHPPDVLLCDVGLPGEMDGYAVARAVRADPALRSAFLIAMTGYGQDRDRQSAEAAGFDLHLTKPLDIDDVERLIAERVPAR